jgi:trigger factor
LQITVTEPKSWLRELEVEIEPERVKQKLNEAIDQLLKEALVPGFRKGHVPRSLIERRFGNEVEAQTAKNLIGEAYEEAVREKNLRPIETGEISDYELTPEKALKFKITLQILPDFELKDYTGIPVKKSEPTGFDAEFDRRLNDLREKLATYTPVSRPSQTGDYLSADYTATDHEGAVIDKKTNVMFEVGDSQNFKELNEAMVGLNPGDEKELVVNMPEDYSDKKYAGKSLRYHIGVRSVKVKSLPEIDEDFAMNLGHENLDQLRVVLNEEILADRKKAVEADLLNQIYQYLVHNHEFEAPPTLVDEALEQMIATNRLEATEEVKTKLRPAAAIRARFQIIIARIAQQEKIEVSDEERDKVIEEYLAESNADKEIADQLRKREGFRYRLLEDKVMHFLLEKAKVEGSANDEVRTTDDGRRTTDDGRRISPEAESC